MAPTCFPLNGTLPAQCLGPKWSLDPPCPKCWHNGLPPTGGVVDINSTLRNAMSERLSEYLGAMERTKPASKDHRSGTVFSGIGGRAPLLKLFKISGNHTYLEQAQPYITAMEAKIPAQRLQDAVSGFTGFFWSRVGMLCISALAAEWRGDKQTVASRVEEVKELFTKRAGRYDDFDSGRAGLLYAAAFLDANLEPSGVPYIPRADVLAVAGAIVERGAQTGLAHGNNFCQWHGPNDKGLWLGQSHGSAGILQRASPCGARAPREQRNRRRMAPTHLRPHCERAVSFGQLPNGVL